MKKLGIIGGMGPAATMYFASRVVDLTEAQNDQEHLDITMLNRPWVPDRSMFLAGDKTAAPFCPPVTEMALQLEHMGCGVICMPCNTAHACFSQIEDVLLRAKMLSMPESVAHIVAEEGFDRIGILATTGTQKAKLYEKAFDGMNVTLVWPDAPFQSQLMEIIYQGVKRGQSGKSIRLDRFLQEFLYRECEAVIIACTELSMLLARDSLLCSRCLFNSETAYPLPIIDALDALALRCIKACGATARETVLNRQCGTFCQSALVDQGIVEVNNAIHEKKEICLCAG